MWDMFQVKNTPYQLRMPLNLSLPPTSSKKFGTYSVVFRAAFIWNNLPAKIKTATTIQQFKKLIKTWQGNLCNCKLCI